MPNLTYAAGVKINQVPIGTTVRLVDCAAHPCSRRLAELGLRPGTEVCVMRRASGGGCVLGIGICRMAIDKASARSLEVEEIPA